jgi:toxin ParE1/3/4
LQLLVCSPHIGCGVDWLLPGLRRFPVGEYLVFFVPGDDGIRIVRVLHGAREISPELFE